jgi:hypothetical protein
MTLPHGSYPFTQRWHLMYASQLLPPLIVPSCTKSWHLTFASLMIPNICLPVELMYDGTTTLSYSTYTFHVMETFFPQ